MSKYTYYVLRTPGTTSDDSENPSVTPTPAPAPVTPTPAPAPVTPTTAPSAGDTSSDSSDSGSSAPEPVLTTTNIAGEQITGWDAITKVISTQTKDKQQNVSGANQDLLHVDASGFDKTIPAATVKAVSTSALRGLHVFISNSDAVTFLAKSKLSGYKETNFEHKDTVTEHSRTIDFTNKQALGINVVFSTCEKRRSDGLQGRCQRQNPHCQDSFECRRTGMLPDYRDSNLCIGILICDS